MTPLEQSLQSLANRRALAFCNNLSLARSLTASLGDKLGVNVLVKRLDRYTDLRTFVGDPSNPVSYNIAEFHRAARDGGLVHIEVTELTSEVIANLRFLEPLLPTGGSKWQLPDYATFSHKEVHAAFYLILSLPSLKGQVALPASLTSRLELMPLEPGTGPAVSEPTIGSELGPGDVLVLMRFRIPALDQWYQTALRPLINGLGKCVRMDGALEDWQSEVVRAIDRADAVLVDLSHDRATPISPNVLWELNQLWNRSLTEHPDGIVRKKMVFVARGLEDVRSCHPRREFVFSSEVGKDWIAGLRTEASEIEELLGFEIRRYDPQDPSSRDTFLSWLRERLAPLVQNVSARLTDSELQRRVDEFRRPGLDKAEAQWLTPISRRDFATCARLARGQSAPPALLDLLGDLLTTVSVADAVGTPGYWGLVRQALRGAPGLREHYRSLLATNQLAGKDPYVLNFCENVWLAFTRISHDLLQDELEQLAELAEAESRPYMREVSDHFRVAHLPKDKQDAALADLLMEHLKSALKQANK